MNTPTTTYTITLTNPDGTRIAELPAVPVNPRYIHLYDDSAELSDNPEPDSTTHHCDTFKRLVAVHVDGHAYALFVRQT